MAAYRWIGLQHHLGLRSLRTSYNPRGVPIQGAEERVLRDDSQGKVVERVIRKYDATGNPGLPIKVRIEEKKNADGSTTVQSSAYESDINGNLQLFERSRENSWAAVSPSRPVLFGKSGVAWGSGLAGQAEEGLRKKERDGRAPAGIFRIGTSAWPLSSRYSTFLLPEEATLLCALRCALVKPESPSPS